MRWVVVITLSLAALRADARTVTGYRHGHRTRIHVVHVGGALAEIHTAIAFRAMARAARRAGIHLYICSGYRTYAKQAALYRRYRRGRGHLAARPGYSKHESGLALDLAVRNHRVYAWLVRHAARYGFRRTVRGEPWHWEYVGGYHPRHHHHRHHVRRSARPSA